METAVPLVAVAVPLAGAAAITLARGAPRLRDALSVGTAALQLLVLLTLAPAIFAGGTLEVTLLPFLPQVAIAFRVDALGYLFATTASFLWLLTATYALGYMRAMGENHLARFHAFLALALASTTAVAFSANLVTMYLFYEALTLATYPLVTHHGDAASATAGRRYLAYHFGTSIAFFLPAIILTYLLAGTFDFMPGGVFPAGAAALPQVVAYVLFLAGIAKAAMVPFHSWLPSAMVAPTPVSALLHAVAVVNAGVFCVLRVMLDVYGQARLAELHLGVGTAVVASLTILLASFYALRMDKLKAILAYSTIAQLSYMILGVALLVPSGTIGGIVHLAIHSFAKITLFFAVGALLVVSGRTRVSELGGLGPRWPWIMGPFAIGALGIVGIPPTGGFITKWYLVVGSIQAGQLAVFGVLLLSTLLTAFYYLRIVRAAFFSAPSGEKPPPAEHGPLAAEPDKLPLSMQAPLVIAAALSLAFGLYPAFLLHLAGLVAR